MKDEGQVHLSCWADDLYTWPGTMNHLARILEDMTNAIERLGMRWKEKTIGDVQKPVCGTGSRVPAALHGAGEWANAVYVRGSAHLGSFVVS